MMIRRLLAILALLISTAPAIAAAPVVAGYSVDTIATVKASNLASKSKITVEGYKTAGDGGKAEYTLSATSCGTDLPGKCLHDGANNSFIRSDWSDSLAPFGFVKGGDLDADANIADPNDATPTITAAIAAIKTKGYTTGHLHGVSVYFATTPTLLDYQGLDCDVTSIGPFDNGHPEGHPGTIYLAHGVTPTTDGSIGQQSLRHCVIVPYWRAHPAAVSGFSGFSFNYPLQNFTDLEAVLGNMVKAGDTALFWDNARNGQLSDLGIYCLDTGIHLNKPNEDVISSIRTDTNVSVFTESGGSSTEFSGVHAQNYCTKQVEDENGDNIPNSENWSIVSISQGATNSWGTHQCRLTLNNGVYPHAGAAPTSDIHTSPLSSQGTPYNYGAFVSNVTIHDVANGVACKGYGQWAVNKISDDGTTVIVDLVGSQLGTGTDKIAATATWSTSGCTLIPNCTLMYIKTGDTNSIQAGETVAGTGIPVGTLVVGVCPMCKGPDPYDGSLEMLVLDHQATLSGSNTAVTFDGGAYVQQAECGDDKVSGCFTLDTTQRFYAGTSAGGQFTMTMPSNNGLSKAAVFACHNTTGIKASKMQSFGHHDDYAINSCNGISVSQQGADDGNKFEDDYDTIGLNLTGNTNKGTFNGAVGGAGIGLNLDLAKVDQTAAHRTTASSGGTGTGLITITTAGSMSTWDRDADGSLTVALCATLNASNECEDGDAGTEYATAEVTASTTLKLLERGQYNTIALALANGWNIVQAPVSSSGGIINIGPGGMNTLGDSSTDLIIQHGSVGIDRVIVRGGGQYGYISNNTDLATFSNTQFKDMTLVYEGLAGFNASTGCGNKFAVSYLWDPCTEDAPSAVTTIDGTVKNVPCDATSGNKAIAVNAGSTLKNFTFTVTKTDKTTNICTVTMSGSDTVGGSSSVILTTFGERLTAQNDNGQTDWIKLQ